VRNLLLTFVSLCVISVVIGMIGVNLLDHNYWNYHGAFLLVFLTLFPRLTLLFSSIPFGGFFWWLGFVFCPRYLVALLATFNYWNANPFLVTLAWFVVIGGEGTEKYYIRRQVYYSSGNQLRDDDVIDVKAESLD